MAAYLSTEERIGGFNKRNIFAFIKYLFFSAALSFIFIGLNSILINYIEQYGYDGCPIHNWEYVWSCSENTFDNTITEWETADSKNPIKYNIENKYLHLRTKIAAPFYNRLSLRSGNNLMNIEVDGEKITEQLDLNYMYSGTRLTEIMLEPSDKAHIIDIYMFVPSPLEFSASMQKVENFEISLLSISEILAAAVFIGIGLILLVIALFGVKKTKKQKLFVLMGANSFIFGIAVLFNQSDVCIKALSSPIFFRFSVFFIMLVFVGMQLFLSEIMESQNKFRWFIYISAVYAFGYILAPYTIIEMFFIRTFGFWSIICLIGFSYIVLYRGVPLDWRNIAIMITYMNLLVFQSLYWISYVFPLDRSFLKVYLIASGVSILAAVIYSFVYSLVISRLSNREKNIFVTEENNEKVYDQIIKLLAKKADTNSSHLENVSNYVRVMCEKLKMPKETIEMVSDAAVLHDIGKIAIPKEILEKEDSISNEEFEQIRCHVLHGYNILIDPTDTFLKTAAQIAKYHHERYDGTGYLGMQGSEIDLYSQITAIADSFDALTSQRSYKKAWSFNEARDYINIHAGDYFDPELVNVFNSCRKEIWDIYQQRNR